jgi:nitroreductase
MCGRAAGLPDRTTASSGRQPQRPQYGGYAAAMDTFLAIASRREVRRYAERPISEEVQRRILDAGRMAGSSRNRQQRRFVAITDRELLDRLADMVYTPGNLRSAQLAVAVVIYGKGPTSFDAGRAAQNMLLAAWNEGVGSSPNGMPDRAAVGEVLGVAEDEEVATVLSFGYPARPRRDPASRSPEEWIAAADRRPFEETVERLGS